jgi:hypothetical protein
MTVRTSGVLGGWPAGVASLGSKNQLRFGGL